MVYRDQMLVCDRCSETFFFTVTEQRRMAEELGHQDFEAPHLCPKCRQQSAATRAPSDVERVEKATERVTEPVMAPEQVIVSESESEPEPKPEPAMVSETLPSFDESLLTDVGIKIKLIGKVKWFSRRKGFGFVTKADGEEVFFHRSEVLDDQARLLRDGTQVEFLVRQTKKGLEAFDVGILPTP